MEIGFIALHRDILDWEWYSDPCATKLFIHCLLKANWQDKQWKGINVPRGSFITGREQLSKETGLTVAQVRTSLERLKRSSNILVEVTNKYSVITIVKYDDYQNTTPTGHQQPTIKTPTDSQQPTTTNKVNNYNKLNNTLMSEIKISDDGKFFIIKEGQIDATDNEVRNFKIAEICREIFIKNLKDAQASTTNPDKAKYKAYTDPIRLMIDSDGVTIEQIKSALHYLKSPEGFFWRGNCFSTKAFRKNISQMLAKKNYQSRSKTQKGTPTN